MTTHSVSISAKLLPVSAIMCVLGVSEDRVVERVQTGLLPWAFDLRTPGCRRACLRVPTKHVVELKNSNGTRPAREESFEEIMDYLVPVPFKTISIAGISRLVRSSRLHIEHLRAHGCLTEIPVPNRGPATSRIIDFNSFREFLRSRKFEG